MTDEKEENNVKSEIKINILDENVNVLSESAVSPMTVFQILNYNKTDNKIKDQCDTIDNIRCGLCGNKVKNSSELCEHLNKKHYFFLMFSCSICVLSFTSYDSLIEHSSVHKSLTSSKRFANQIPICGICGKAFSDIKMANSHILNHHYYYICPKKRPYLCLHCEATLYGEQEFLLHLQQHCSQKRDVLTYGEQLYCDICKEFSSGYDAFLSHYKNVHSDVRTCHVCLEDVADSKEYGEHVLWHVFRTEKNEFRFFLCFICDLYLLGITSFHEHFRKIHVQMKK